MLPLVSCCLFLGTGAECFLQLWSVILWQLIKIAAAVTALLSLRLITHNHLRFYQELKSLELLHKTWNKTYRFLFIWNEGKWQIPNCNTALERPGAGKVFTRLMDRKGCRSVQLLLGCSPQWRMHRVQSLPQDTPAVHALRISSFCTLPLVLRFSQAVTAQWERHIPSPGKVHKTLRHPVVTPLLSPSKTSSQELS